MTVGDFGWFPNIPRFSGSALCAEADPEVWFPEKGSSNRRAKAICERCEARVECLLWSLDNAIPHGVWGAVGEKQRAALVRQRNARRAA